MQNRLSNLELSKRYLEVIQAQNNAFLSQIGSFAEALGKNRAAVADFDAVCFNLRQTFRLSTRINEMVLKLKGDVAIELTGFLAEAHDPRPLGYPLSHTSGHPVAGFSKNSGELRVLSAGAEEPVKLSPQEQVSQSLVRQRQSEVAELSWDRPCLQKSLAWKPPAPADKKDLLSGLQLPLGAKLLPLATKELPGGPFDSRFIQTFQTFFGDRQGLIPAGFGVLGEEAGAKRFGPPRDRHGLHKTLGASSKIGKRERGSYKICPMQIKHQAITISRHSGIKYAADLLKIPEKNIKRWMKQGPERKKGAGRKTMDPEMEAGLLRWIADTYRDTKVFPDFKEVKAKAKEFSSNGSFKASKGWCDKFMKRNYQVFSQLRDEVGRGRLAPKSENAPGDAK